MTSEIEAVDKIRRFLRQPESELFVERVEEKQRRALTDLKNGVDLHGIGYSQGQLYVLDWILRLRREEE